MVGSEDRGHVRTTIERTLPLEYRRGVVVYATGSLCIALIVRPEAPFVMSVCRATRAYTVLVVRRGYSGRVMHGYTG